MKLKLSILVFIPVLFTGCTFVKSHLIRGTWALQEIQIPLSEDFEPLENYDYYETISITDHSYEIYGVDGLNERWSYTINNDSILELSTGNRFRSLVIKRIAWNELVLVDNQAPNGYTVYYYVPMGGKTGPVKYSKIDMGIPSNDSLNPIVKRLSPQEVAQCKTPAALAYNFVIAILEKDYDRMYSYMIDDGEYVMLKLMDRYEVTSLNALFSLDGKLHVFSWIPALEEGCEVAVLYVQDEGDYKKVYVGCVPSSQIGVAGFQDIERYGDNETNVKVVVVNEDGNWKVAGFK